MNKGFGIAFAVGTVIAAAGIFGIFYAKQGVHPVTHGSVLKVRTHAIDDNNSIAVLEVRLKNESDVAMAVSDIEVNLDTKDGHKLSGAMLSGADAKSVFKYYPQLGERFNEPLISQDRVDPRQTVDRMLAMRFEAPENTIQERKKITVRVQDVNGQVSEFSRATP